MHWKDYQNFLYRLDKAVLSQQEIVQDCERSLDAHRQRWLQKRQRRESLQKVQTRYLKEAEILDDRREQRVLDDLPNKAPIFDED